MGAGNPAADELRALPSVEVLSARLDGPRPLAVRAAREAIEMQRRSIRATGSGATDDLAALAQRKLDALVAPSFRRVLNATGVVIHTNLGRAPLPDAAREAVARAADGYSNLEYDLDSGDRGARQEHVAEEIAALTGAEAGFVVNNGAGAALLAIAALAGPGKEVIVSRGQLVEIGGGFRVPDVVRQMGARLIEVGTTNRTRLSDYAEAVGPDTGAILRVHPSNFRQVGFVEEVGIAELCTLGPPVVDDVGSGAVAALDLLADEPSIRASVSAGAAIVCFSGDKLLGGPQAGLLAGTHRAITLAVGHPLARALRLDKLSLAALEATLRLYRDPAAALEEIPVLRMLRASEEELAARAERLADAFSGAEVVRATAKVGGGALPLLELEGPVVALDPGLARELRLGDPPIVGRVSEDRLLLDPRTLTDEEVGWIAATR